MRSGKRLLCSLLILLTVFSAFAAQAQEKPGTDWRSSITKVAKAAIPAVVHIEVTQKQEVASPAAETDPLLRRFFDLPDSPKKFRRELKGIGTGILINPQGYILTNSHVVAGATRVQVHLTDGREYAAKMIGTDPKTDLAVILISGKNPFPYLKFGDSDRVEVGEWVIAIGHPRGLNQTVTQGVISAMHRRGITDPSGYQDFLQTDTAINPGNSGGPLLNLEGAIIGINSAIASASGGFEGIGFAIPSNMAFHISRALMAHGKVERGWLGVSVQDLTYEQARSLGLASSRGAFVTEVAKGGPAEKAGVLKGDVIVEYSGAEVSDASDLRNGVAVTEIGKEVSAVLWRKGRKVVLNARIGSLETATRILASSVKERLGAEFRPVTAKEAEKYGLEAPVGVAVASVASRSPIKAAGIETDDIILGINGQIIEGMDSFVAVVSAISPKREVALLALDHRSGRTGAVRIMMK